MPPYLAIPHFHLSKLPITTKAALTVFLLALLGGEIFVAVAVFAELTGCTARGVKLNYRGSEEVARETGEIPKEFAAGKTRREVYDFVVHPHSFVMPLIYFVLCHLMEMTHGARGWKLAVYILTGAAMLAVVFAPVLLLRTMGAAALLVAGVVVLLPGFFVMTIVPAFQMWRAPTPRSDAKEV